MEIHYRPDGRVSQFLLKSVRQNTVILNTSYHYDQIGRLLRAVWTIGLKRQESEKWTYDINGQVNSFYFKIFSNN